MNRLSYRVLCVYLLLSTYVLGGAVIEGFVYYPAWKTVGPVEFPAFHRSLSSRLLPVFVLPFVLSVVANAVLLWKRPPELPRSWVAMALVLNDFILLVTLQLAIPIQMQLSRALSQDAIDTLIVYDRALRLVPGLAVGMLNVAMIDRLCRSRPEAAACDPSARAAGESRSNRLQCRMGPVMPGRSAQG